MLGYNIREMLVMKLLVRTRMTVWELCMVWQWAISIGDNLAFFNLNIRNNGFLLLLSKSVKTFFRIRNKALRRLSLDSTFTLQLVKGTSKLAVTLEPGTFHLEQLQVRPMLQGVLSACRYLQDLLDDVQIMLVPKNSDYLWLCHRVTLRKIVDTCASHTMDVCKCRLHPLGLSLSFG